MNPENLTFKWAGAAACPLIPILSRLTASGRQPLVVRDAADGFELATPRESGGGRCRLRILQLQQGKEAGKWIAFFYKPSVVPHSLDRYSYGSTLFDDRLDEARVEKWLAYVASQFDPALLPPDVRRAIPYTLPDFVPFPAGAAGPATGPGAAPGPAAAASAAGPAAPATTGREAVVTSGRGAPPPDIDLAPGRPLNPGELEVDLFCRGLRIDPSCALEDDARVFSRTRAGLGSGLELILPGPLKDIWTNIPVEEDFAQDSPYRLIRVGPGDYRVIDERRPVRPESNIDGGCDYPARLPSEPAWYRKTTSRGTPMARVGVLQGTYLGIYISNSCGFWYHQPDEGCKFCATGLNVGVNEVVDKNVDDVVEVALAAREESGNTFVHFNSGYQGGDLGLDTAAPFVKAVKERVGAMIGVQVIPSANLWKYDWLIDLGTNHFSFCYEFHNPEYFAKYLPGKERLVGQKTFFDALEYTAKKLGKGTCSGEIIAGVEPLEDTLKAIDYITSVGAFPTVCIFRPVIGAAMERYPSPRPDEMAVVMRHMYEACRRNHIPIGMAPNIEVSIIVNPEDARYLVRPDWKVKLYEMELATLKWLARTFVFSRELKPKKISASATDSSAYRPR